MFRALALGFAAALVFGFTACSSVPDEANPAEWFGEDKPEDTAEVGGSDEAVPGAESDFPNLASVPPKPEAMTTLEEREDIAQGLVADRARAKYSDPVSRLAPVTVAPPAPAAPAPVEVVTPAPAPVSTPAPEMAPEAAAIPPAPRPAVPPEAPAVTPTSEPESAVARSASPPPVRSVTPPAPPPAAAPSKGEPGAAIAAEAAAEAKASEAPAITPAPPPAPPAPAAATPNMRPKAPPVAPPAPQIPSRAQAAAPAPAPMPVPAQAPVRPQTVPAQPPLVPSASVARAEDAMVLIESGNSGGGQSVVAGFTPGNVGTDRPVALIFFGNGSANLSTRDNEILRDVAQLYNQRGGGRLRVVGHASSSVGGSDPVKQRLANFKISVDRSSAVARSLTDSGVPAGIVEVDAVSDNAPLLEGGEAADRRVEIYLN